MLNSLRTVIEVNYILFLYSSYYKNICSDVFCMLQPINIVNFKPIIFEKFFLPTVLNPLVASPT